MTTITINPTNGFKSSYINLSRPFLIQNADQNADQNANQTDYYTNYFGPFFTGVGTAPAIADVVLIMDESNINYSIAWEHTKFPSLEILSYDYYVEFVVLNNIPDSKKCRIRILDPFAIIGTNYLDSEYFTIKTQDLFLYKDQKQDIQVQLPISSQKITFKVYNMSISIENRDKNNYSKNTFQITDPIDLPEIKIGGETGITIEQNTAYIT